MSPTNAPIAPAPVSRRPSSTLATRRIEIGPDDSIPGMLAAVVSGDVVTIRPRPGIILAELTLPASSRAGWVSLGLDGITSRSLGAVAGAQFWRVEGLTVERDPSLPMVYDLVNLAHGSRSIALEQVAIHGTPNGQTRRGLSMNGADQSVTRSTITEIHETGADSQAISGIHGAGPFLIEDMALDCGTENIMFGGGDPSTRDLIPSDITIRRVTFSKSPTMLSGPWVRKNLFELKNAQRVLVEDCEFSDFPGGVAWVLTVRNQDGTAPWCTVRDLLIRNCHVRRVGSVFSGHTTDNEQPSAMSVRVAIRNVLCQEIDDGFFFWGAGRPGVAMEDLEVSHCTALPCRRAAFTIEATFRRLKFTDNVLGFGSYSQQWTDALAAAEDSDVRNNLMVNAGDLDGGGPDRNRMDGVRFITIADVAALGSVTWPSTDGAPPGYSPVETAPVPVPVPVPAPSVDARVTALEQRVTTLEQTATRASSLEREVAAIARDLAALATASLHDTERVAMRVSAIETRLAQVKDALQ